MSPTLELLAPARDADIGIAAVDHGADAVYMGGPAFGARVNAGNSLQDLERVAAHAHRYGARLYVTLNTILRDDELEPARDMAWRLYEAGVDALIVQDMGLLQLALPPLQLHASTQCDVRTPEKARFLQDVGFSKIILARELSLPQIQAVAAQVQQATLEFFIHGALCVAYSGNCFISHAHTGRSANRGNCSQECRLPYTVKDAAGRIVAHDSHVLSVKDNDQSANLAALVDAGVRSFKVEGRYKDMGYVKNVTAHYRRLLDALLAQRPGLAPSALGHSEHFFTPDPARNFNRGATDYFVNGRQDDIGAFATPKHAGLPLGTVLALDAASGTLDIALDLATDAMNNGDGLTWLDLQGELQGLQANVATPLGGPRWRLAPNEPLDTLKDLRPGTALSRNRDMAWDRLLQRDSARRLMGLVFTLERTGDQLHLRATAEGGVHVRLPAPWQVQPARSAEQARAQWHKQLAKLGGTPWRADAIHLPADPGFAPAAAMNALRREVLAALDAARAAALPRLPRAQPVQPPAAYPEPVLTYLANVYNHAAHDFYRAHGVQVVEAAYESHQQAGDVSLMITKHCVRWSLSLCPKQAKGVQGVQGTVRAEPMTITSGGDTLTLRFDCKPCEMHVVGRARRHILDETPPATMRFYRQRPTPAPTA